MFFAHLFSWKIILYFCFGNFVSQLEGFFFFGNSSVWKEGKVTCYMHLDDLSKGVSSTNL